MITVSFALLSFALAQTTDIDRNRVAQLAKVESGVSQGPFAPTWSSLKAGYTVPKWYEDAKFGIFIHWGVYSVPGFGSEWYPRQMYQAGSGEFNHHVATYGPQTQFGYKDFIPQFKAAKYDPDQWAGLFREAGAKFVVPVAEHHDGFAMYDSALSRWTAKKMGPRRDLIGDLAKAVRKKGLVFGLSSHRAEHWFFMNGGKKFASDVQDPAYADFYGPAQPDGTEPDKAHLDDWLARSTELVDKYHPQLVWFDWWIERPAFASYLKKFAAYYYNQGSEWDKGVAINYKYGSFPEGTAVLDIERGQLSGIRQGLWQTDTSVAKNSWGYTEHQDYKSAGEIVHDLIDIVSKHGNLLLNIGPKPDGTIAEPEQEMLRRIGRWLKVNGEGIYGTSAWTKFGEGPTKVGSGAFTDTNRQSFTPEDFRFTRKGNTLYVHALGVGSTRALVIRSLAGASVRTVRLLGSKQKLEWSVDSSGLDVTLPAELPSEFASTLAVTGVNLDAKVETAVLAGAGGQFTLLPATGTPSGSGIQTETKGGKENFGFWDNPSDSVSWEIKPSKAGRFRVGLEWASQSNTALLVEVGSDRMSIGLAATKGWDDFRASEFGEIMIPAGRVVRVKLSPKPGEWKAINLRQVTLTPVLG